LKRCIKVDDDFYWIMVSADVVLRLYFPIGSFLVELGGS